MWTDQHSDRLDRIAQDVHYMKRELEKFIMARQDTDAAIIAEVHRNTQVVKDVIAEQTVLIKELADAVANSGAADDPDVVAALNELRSNNDALAAQVVSGVAAGATGATGTTGTTGATGDTGPIAG